MVRMLLQLPGLFCDLSNMFVALPLRAVHRLAGLVLAVYAAPPPRSHEIRTGTPRPRRRITRGRPTGPLPLRNEESSPLHPRPRRLPRRLLPRARAGRAEGGVRPSGPLAEAGGPRLGRRPPDEAPPRLPAVLRRRAQAAARRGARGEERALRAPEHRDRPRPRLARDGGAASRHRDRREPLVRAARRRVAPAGLLHRPGVRRSRRRRHDGFRPGPGNLRVPTLGDRLLERYPRARVVALSGKDRGAIFMAGKRREHAVYWWDQETGRFVIVPRLRRRVRPAAPSWRRSSPSSTGPAPEGTSPAASAWPGGRWPTPSSRPGPPAPDGPPRPRVRDAAVPDPGERARLGQGHVPRLERLLPRHLLQPVHRRARRWTSPSRSLAVEGPRARPRGAARHPLPLALRPGHGLPRLRPGVRGEPRHPPPPRRPARPPLRGARPRLPGGEGRPRPLGRPRLPDDPRARGAARQGLHGRPGPLRERRRDELRGEAEPLPLPRSSACRSTRGRSSGTRGST